MNDNPNDYVGCRGGCGAMVPKLGNRTCQKCEKRVDLRRLSDDITEIIAQGVWFVKHPSSELMDYPATIQRHAESEWLRAYQSDPTFRRIVQTMVSPVMVKVQDALKEVGL